MDTTVAAAHAGVTIDTIRTWCRRGVIAATKTAGRWVIDEASLKARLRLGRRLARLRAQRLAPRARRQLLARLTLPALTGTPKQVAWAEDIRARRIDHAVQAIAARGRIVYQLAGPDGDPLGLNYLPVTTDPRTGWKGAYTTLAGALDALHTAVTHGARTTASWWIDTRAQNTPL